MPKEQAPSSSDGIRGFTWALALGVLAWCGITLLGVVLQLPPEVILLRSLVGSAAVAMVVVAVITGWSLIAPEDENE